MSLLPGGNHGAGKEGVMQRMSNDSSSGLLERNKPLFGIRLRE
jgi:hypothetical protein